MGQVIPTCVSPVNNNKRYKTVKYLNLDFSKTCSILSPGSLAVLLRVFSL